MMKPLNSVRNWAFHLFPAAFWQSYRAKAAKAGIREPLILLSYDSDTDEDAEASVVLFEKLHGLGIPATFAVPGVHLERGAKEYRNLYQLGAKFINHGGAAHTEWRDGHYGSVNFYNQKSASEVIQDIREGHRIFQAVLNEEPSGFRAPHFGHFQDDQALSLIHAELRRLGTYRFCSSSLAVRTRSNGPLIRMNGLWELPITGTYEWPTRIFDSYGHLVSKRQRRVSDEYARKWIMSVREFHSRGIPVLINYYADPSHVVESKAYFEALQQAKALGVRFVDFDEVLEMVAKTE